MKYVWGLLTLCILSMTSVLAVPGPALLVDIEPIDDVIIAGIESNATYTFTVTNTDVTDTFQIYSLIEPYFEPGGFFTIENNETVVLDVIVTPVPQTVQEYRGAYQFQYEIKGEDLGFYVGRMDFTIYDIEDAFEVTALSITPTSSEAIIVIDNVVGFTFEDVTFEVDSPFFSTTITESFAKNESKQFRVPVTKPSGVSAGEYAVGVGIGAQEASGELLESITYLAETGLSESSASSGMIIRRGTISMTNEGNVDEIATISMSKNILTRLFTVFSEQPARVDKSGLFVYYEWEQVIAPGETYSVTATTNYTLPFLLALFVVILIYIIWRMNAQIVTIQKRVTYVKTRGGELALRVRLKVKARKKVTDAVLTDRLPSIAKLYEGFARKPDHINHSARTISWNMHTLDAGEERVFTYIMYSKISIVGRLALPLAHVTYKRNGKAGKGESNATSFLQEQSDSHTE